MASPQYDRMGGELPPRNLIFSHMVMQHGAESWHGTHIMDMRSTLYHAICRRPFNNLHRTSDRRRLAAGAHTLGRAAVISFWH